MFLIARLLKRISIWNKKTREKLLIRLANNTYLFVQHLVLNSQMTVFLYFTRKLYLRTLDGRGRTYSF